MITKLELTQLITEADEIISITNREITGLASTKMKNADEYKLKAKELRRLKSRLKFYREKSILYKTIIYYVSSDIQQEYIESQRNALLIRLSTIRDREGVELVNRTSGNPEDKKGVARFDAKYGVKKLKAQLKTLSFILGK